MQKSLVALKDLTPTQMAALHPGEAYVWANKASDPEFTNKAVKIYQGHELHNMVAEHRRLFINLFLNKSTFRIARTTCGKRACRRSTTPIRLSQ
jgi:hypothetical protein